MHRTQQPALALSQSKNICAASSAYRTLRCTRVLNIRRPMQACLYTTNCLNFYCECALSFIASVFERTRKFGESVPEGLDTLEHVCSETLLWQRTFEHARSGFLLSQHNFEYARSEFYCRSVASITLAAGIRVFSRGEYSKPRPLLKLRCDHCRSFDPFEWVSQFFFFSHAETRSTVLASLTACRRVLLTD